MTRKQYREIQVKQKVNLTEQNRIHFLVNLNSMGFQRRKVIERKNKRLDYYTTLFVRMQLQKQSFMPRHYSPSYGCITVLKNGRYEEDFINDMPF